MVRRGGMAFPVGLYGILLFALCWLTLPTVFAPLERIGLGAVSLVPHALARWSGTPVFAAESGEAARLAELTAELRARCREHDIAPGRTFVPIGLEPVHCAVVSTGGRGGGGGEPSELQLDHSYAELAGSALYVTKGDVLIGWLQQPGVGIAAADQPEDLARVALLNHRASRSVYAEAASDVGASLRMVVGPAGAVDPAPLRVELWDNPYLAARLNRGGQPVHLLELPDEDWLATAAAPPGLWLGRTRIWGYEGRQGEQPLTIGVFVVPPYEPRSLSHVVVWRRAAAGDASTALRHRRIPATLWQLPGGAEGRMLLAAAVGLPSGAAVVDAGRCVGITRGLAFGKALVTPFAESRQRWNLILLPRDRRARPRELAGHVEWAAGGAAVVRVRSDTVEGPSTRLPDGSLFTGSNGRDCPAGLYLGEARADRDALDLLVVRAPLAEGARAVEVLVEGGAP